MALDKIAIVGLGQMGRGILQVCIGIIKHTLIDSRISSASGKAS